MPDKTFNEAELDLANLQDFLASKFGAAGDFSIECIKGGSLMIVC